MCVTQSEYTKGTRLTLSFIKSLSLVSWKDGLMLMNVIKLISSPFFDSKISNTALANPPHAPFHSAPLLDEKIKGLKITQ